MDYNKLVEKIYPEGVEFNMACFEFSEEEARQRNLWRDPRAMPTQEQLDAALLEVNKETQEGVLYREMEKDIYDEMETVFGTRNDISVAAFVSTYEAMLKRPENFVDVELGLADAAAVTAYASAKLNNADAYGVFRLKRIAQFQADKAAL